MGVSVVIPLYNKARHIRRAIDSVLAQTYQHFEVIVIDDGSTDGGGDVVRRMDDPRIRLIVQQNAGVSAARNRGIDEASFDEVAFLDADDEWLPCFLEAVVGLRARYPEAGLYATAYRLSRDEAVWRPAFFDCVESPQGGLLDDYFRAASVPEPIRTSGAMIPKAVLDEVGGFPVGVGAGEDVHMWARIALRYPVAWSPVEGALYHISADNRLSKTNPVMPDVAEASVIEEFLRSGREPLSPRRTVEEYLVSRRLPLALECYLRGQKAWALALLAKTRGTARFRRRRLFLRCAFLIPPSILRGARGAKHRIRLLKLRIRGTPNEF